MKEWNRKNHWEKIYETKAFEQTSWYQKRPEVSLEFIQQLQIPKTAKIIDIGGGDSFFVDYLLESGYTNVTVLDISALAIERAKKRLGQLAEKVNWIVTDVVSFQPTETYDVWHDRAAFHFLTEQQDIEAYITSLVKGTNEQSRLIIGTFSEQGPKKCSGIPIKQYSDVNLVLQINPDFEKISCFTSNHITPFDTVQNFTFCSFKRVS